MFLYIYAENIKDKIRSKKYYSEPYFLNLKKNDIIFLKHTFYHSKKMK